MAFKSICCCISEGTGTQNELGVTFTFLTSTSDIVVRAQGGWEWDDPCFRVRHNVGAVSCLFSEY